MTTIVVAHIRHKKLGILMLHGVVVGERYRGGERGHGIDSRGRGDLGGKEKGRAM
jgi:hypothetical protein